MTTILIIEDEAILREEVVEWLSMEGYTAVSAADGVIGVEIASRQRPDLIVCDITMPRLDGYGVLLTLHTNPSTMGIPFIFVTARAAHENIRQGMALGADDYITKPFTRLELLQTIQTRLAKKQAQEEAHQFSIDQLQNALVQEHEQRLLKAKLVAMFSHDFRNPLTSILMTVGALRDHIDRMDREHRLVHLQRVETSVHQLMQILDDVLLVAQMETGKLDLKLELLNIGLFLRQIVEDFQAIHGEKHPILFENQLTTPIVIDTRLFRQIATNLLSNAIKYSLPGHAIHIVLSKQADQCILTVQDRGIGIPETDQTRLFDVFQRGSNVGDVPGTGLGLALVKQAVALLDGSIELESQVGAGTSVRVTIPPQQYPPQQQQGGQT